MILIIIDMLCFRYALISFLHVQKSRSKGRPYNSIYMLMCYIDYIMSKFKKFWDETFVYP